MFTHNHDMSRRSIMASLSVSSLADRQRSLSRYAMAMEWELSKENVQPLREGRNVEKLNACLLKARLAGASAKAKVSEEHRCPAQSMCFYMYSMHPGCLLHLHSLSAISSSETYCTFPS